MLFPTDAEKGEGVKLAKTHDVSSYPAFLLIDNEGRVVNRWVGYSKKMFMGILGEAASDLTPIETRMKRFKSKPTPADAAALGHYYNGVLDFGKSVAHYRKVQELDSNYPVDYTTYIFQNVYWGHSEPEKAFSFDELREAADMMIASSGTSTYDKTYASYVVTRFMPKDADEKLLKTYLEKGIASAKGSDDPQVESLYASLMVQHSLEVSGDKDKAVVYYKKTLPEGWRDSSSSLNAFAWWCYENRVNLEEAQELARKAVKLAKPGKEKAMILDTLAEICNELGNCDESIELIEMALKEDPDKKYYTEQLERFKKILAEQSGTP